MHAHNHLLQVSAGAEGIDDGQADYEALAAPPGFVRAVGPFFLHQHCPILATRVAETHLNSLRIAHGGFLATLADSAFGVVLKREMGLAMSPATASLQLDYISAAREGEWLQAHVELLKPGRQLINASCALRVDERLVLRASGIFMRADHLQRSTAG